MSQNTINVTFTEAPTISVSFPRSLTIEGGGGGEPGSGTVTSVNASGGATGFSFSGGPITDSGTLTLAVSNASTIRSAIGLGTLATQSGTFSGTSSGTNTGDQTITLTGDVTGSGTGTFAATIANDAVTYAKLQNVSATDKVLGRSSVGAGDVEEITCTAAGRALIDDADASAQRTTLGLGTLATQSGTFSGTSSGTNTGDQTISLTGDVTGSGTGSFAATIANDAVTNAKLANMTASTIKGRKTGSTGDPEDCTLSEVLDLVGSAAQGDILYRGASGWTRLGAGTSGHYLQTQGAAANPQWAEASGSSSSYITLFQHNSIATSPSDSATLYCSTGNLRSTYADAVIKVPVTGTVVKYWVRVAFNGTLGTTEDVNYYLRLNDTTDFGNMVDDWDAYSEVTSSTLSQAVTAGDSLALKIVTPAWATNPTNVYLHFWILIQV